MSKMPNVQNAGSKAAVDLGGPTKKKKKNRVRKRNRNKGSVKKSDDTNPITTSSTALESEPLTATIEAIFEVRELPQIQEPSEITKPIRGTIKTQKHIEMKQTQDSPLSGQCDISRQQILAQREANKLAKQAKKQKKANAPDATPDQNNINMLNNVNTTHVSSEVASTNKKKLPVKEAAEEVSTKPAATPITNKKISPVKEAAEEASTKPAATPITTNKKNSPVKEEAKEVSTKPAATPITTKSMEKSREQIKAEREAKKLAKQATKAAKLNISADVGDVNSTSELTQQMANIKVSNETKPTSSSTENQKTKPTLTKAERRAIQEAQRASKSNSLSQKLKSNITSASPVSILVNKTSKITDSDVTRTSASPAKRTSGPTKALKAPDCNVKLFNHLVRAQKDINLFVNNPQIHPIIARLGEQYAKRTVVGSNSRCIAFLNALKIVIQDFETPPKKEFARSLEAFTKNCVDHLNKCRPLAVSVSNAYKHIKHILTQLPTDKPESELKEYLCHFIDTYLENQIGKAALAISYSMQEKISNGDVILTFSCSSLINYIFEEAHRRHVDFRVIVVDSRPFCEGQELLRRLCAKEIPCTYVLINAVSFVMPEVTKILLGAHALLSNGYVMARTGTAQIALVGRSFNVPVLVCCETHKFSERFQTDAIVYNELGDPDDLIMSDKCCLINWQGKHKMSPLNLNYDVTPPELVTAVVTEVSILPCTSVPVILRIKPTEIGYYN